MNSLLLLHGAIGAKDQLKPLAEALSNDFDVHTINFSGHGGEDLPPSYSIERFADDVLNWMVEHNKETIDIFGYSMGGYVGLYLALHHPERVGKLFTLATKLEWSPDIAARETKMLNPEKIAEKVPAFATALEQRHAPQDWTAVMHRTADMMVKMGEKNPILPEQFEQIETPVTISLGDRDSMVSMDETYKVYRQLKNARMIMMPDTPHPIEKVSTSRLSAEILQFFGEE